MQQTNESKKHYAKQWTADTKDSEYHMIPM